MGFPPIVSALVSLLVALSWIFSGTVRPTKGWKVHCFFVISVTFALSLFLSMNLGAEESLPSTIHSDGKVLLNREWGRRRALLVSTSYGKMAVYVHPSAAPAEGSGVRISGALFDFGRADRSGDFDEYLYWKSKGAVKKMIPLKLKVTSRPEGIYRWRNFLERKIKQDLPELMSGYMLALTLGIRDKKLAEKHRKAGTIHLLAVSGFHVGILAAAAGLFLKRGKIKLLLISVLIWSYLALAGSPPGGIRAGIMLQVYMLGLFLGRPSSSFNSVSVAGIIMLILAPETFHDIGWRLSMLAALSICAASGVVDGRGYPAVLLGSAAVWFVTAPFIASAFGEVPAVGLLINIAAVPLFALIFPFVLISSIPAFLGLPFGYRIAAVCEYILESWDIFSGKLIELMPWSALFTIPLAVFALFIFFLSAAYASGITLKRVPVSAAMFSLLTLLLT